MPEKKLETNGLKREDIGSMEEQSLTTLWYRPRKIVRYLDRSLKAQLRIITALALIYFIQASIFMLSLDKITLAPLFTPKGLLLIIYAFLTIGIGAITAIYASTLAIWTGAKVLDGQGTLTQTRAAVIWTLVWSIPIGFFLLVIYLTIRQPDHGLVALLMRIVSYLGVLATAIYGFIVLLKTISEVQSFGLSRALASVIFGVLLLAAIGYTIVKFL